MRPRIYLTALFTAIVGLLPGAAAADTQPAPGCATTAPIGQLATDYIFRPVLSCQVELEAGRQYRLSGRWAGTSAMGSLMGSRIEAYPLGATSATQRIRGSLSTRNHEGTENGLAVGTVRAIGSEWLFEPEQSGIWVIELRGEAGRCDVGADLANPAKCVTQPQYHVAVVPGSNTFLRLADVSYAGGSEWRQGSDVHFGNPAGDTPRPRAVDVLSRTTTLPAGTTQAHVWTGVGMSVESTGGTAALSTRLTAYARQVRADGSYCNSHSVKVTGTISGTLHHYRFNQVQSYALDPACGSTRVNVKVYVEYLAAPAGQPERHGGVVHGDPYTGAHIIPIE